MFDSRQRGYTKNLTAPLSELPLDEAAAFRQLVSQLRAWPEASVSEGFSSRVMSALEEEFPQTPSRPVSRFRFPFWRISAAAALVALLLSAGYFFMGRHTVPGTVPASADLDWLASVQDASGFWVPEQHGGSAVYRPALTALAMLALAEERDPERYAGQIRLASDALARCQEPSGAFGGDGRAERYNHAITTFALASLAPRLPAIRPILEKAVGFIARSQSAAGGWDYVADSEGNTALTAWNLRALACAQDRGVASASTPFRKGLRWLTHAVRSEGAVVYHADGPVSGSESLQALTAFALLNASHEFPELEALGRTIATRLTLPGHETVAGSDCYREYVKYLAFTAAGDTARAREVSDRLRAHPLKDLREDAWGSVGGFLYARSLTALSQSR